MKDCFDYLTTFGRAGKGVVVCLSTGDNPENFHLYCPWAAYPKTIAAGASTAGDVMSPFSGFGSAIDVCAPGGDGATDLVTSNLVGCGNLAGNTGTRQALHERFHRVRQVCLSHL